MAGEFITLPPMSLHWLVYVHVHVVCDNGIPPQVLCTAAVNPATFLDDCAKAINIRKDPPIGSTPTPDDTQQELSMSLVWIVTGVPNLTKVRHTL